MADKMKKAVEEAKQDAVKAVEEVKSETEKVIAEVKEQVKPAVEKAKAVTKQSAEKAVDATKKTVEKAAKAPAKAKTAVEKAARKAVTGEYTPVVYVQYQGDEEKVEDLIAAATAAFHTEHLRTKITDLRLYIKPEERAAYYVVNEKFAGRVDF